MSWSTGQPDSQNQRSLFVQWPPRARDFLDFDLLGLFAQTQMQCIEEWAISIVRMTMRFYIYCGRKAAQVASSVSLDRACLQWRLWGHCVVRAARALVAAAIRWCTRTRAWGTASRVLHLAHVSKLMTFNRGVWVYLLLFRIGKRNLCFQMCCIEAQDCLQGADKIKVIVCFDRTQSIQTHFQDQAC